jgi:hypothetical protein
MADEKAYLDAKFDGLEKLLKAETTNLKEYITAVSANNKEYRHDCEEKVAAVDVKLQEHEKSPEAHGAGVIARGKGEWVSLLMLAVSVGLLAVDIWKKAH